MQAVCPEVNHLPANV